MEKDGNQEYPDNKHIINMEQECKISSLEKRLSNYGRFKEQTRPVAEYLLELRRYKEAKKLLDCGGTLHFREWFDHERMTLAGGYFCCQNRLCKMCAVRRSAKLLRVLTGKTLSRMAEKPFKAYLVTFTVKNGVDLSETYEKLSEALSGRQKGREGIMRKRERHLAYLKRGRGAEALAKTYTEASKAEGAAGVVEIKRGARSGLWHPHIHMIWLLDAETPAPDMEALSDELLGVTGDSHMVDVREFVFSMFNLQHDPEAVARDLVEVCTYVLKLASLSAPDVVEAADFLYKRHLVKTWGNLRFTKEEAESIEDPFDEELDGPYVDHIFRWDGTTYRKEHSPGQDRNTDTRQGVGV